MIISLDYDDTYTRDPLGWDDFIKLFKSRGHTIYCVTMRSSYLHESLEVMNDLINKVDAIFFTNRSGKKDYMCELGIWIDVWIDDSPDWILKNAKG